MALTWELDRFRPQDAAGVVELYRAVYGDNYPVKAVYDPQALILQEETGEACRAVARTEDGSVVGHMSLYRSSPPNPELYEFGQMMVRHDYRQSTVAAELSDYSVQALPELHHLEQVWGEAVCNHLVTQQFSLRQGFVATGLEVALMRGESYSRAFKEVSADRERVSTLLVFRSFHVRPQTLYLPKVYESVLGFIYEATDFGHSLLLSEEKLPAGIETQATLQSFADAGIARFTFETLGEDFEMRLAELESQASEGGAVVTQVFLRLTERCSGAAVEILRRHGYFLGGALPRWFDDDGLLMQKVRVAVDFEKIFVYGKRAKKLKEIIRQDMESVRPLTVGGVLLKTARLLPDKTALIYPQRNRAFTYAQLAGAAGEVAGALTALGFERGEHAAIWAPNVPEYLPVEFGCALAGVPLVLINVNYRAYELEYVLKQSDTTILFMADGAARPGEYPEALLEARERLPLLRTVVVFGDYARQGMITWQDFLDHAAKEDKVEFSARMQETSGNDIVTILYTSGTTGSPKGVMLSHAAFVTSAEIYLDRQGLKSGDVLCNPLPFFHIYGNVPTLSALMAGATLAVLEKFQAPEMLQVMEKHKVTAVSGTPTMFVAALAELSRKTYDLSSLRGGNMGGAVSPPQLVRAVVETMGAKRFGVLYGSTEGFCNLLSASSAPLAKRMETVGNPMPGYEMKIVDPLTGREVETGSQGELLIRGPVMMTRYYKMEEATARAIDPEGWLHTGDMAGVDADGYYRITGRIKDMIIRGGENIYPAEIEEFLLTHPKVLDAQVVGVPCEYYGEDVVAFLRLKQGESAGVLEMKRYCRARIAIIKVPAMFFFVDQYPLTASGKVQKFKLRELAIPKMAENRIGTK